ncbi:Sugar transporter ERD6-like 5 [Camellia lanceoleosa]|uniref:Sugar transporter ERD6-like 5 n=1 Tax=Camellia lanceoleosa TaxID=1840588 RepID=A0ACC0I9G6_9ERIC|nr:Sugar transporter ERD6-like 5 [Camellia lanceoleosa]
MEKNLLEGEQTRSPLLVHRANGRDDSEMQSNNDGESPATTIVVISTLIACCGSYVFGAAVGYSSPAESGIMDDLGLSDAAYSVFGSILTLGALLGAVMCGKMADLIGRRGTMAFSQIFCIIGWFAIAFAEGAWNLDLGRLSLGYGIGLLSYVVPVYIAEITPKNLRGGFTTVNQLLVTTGLSMTYLIGIVVNWRVLSLIGVVPCVLQLLGLYFMPESPRWLAMLGRWSQCKVALQRLRGQNANISEEEHEIREYTETLQLFPNPNIFDIFRRKYAHSLIVGVGLMVLQQFGGVNAIGYYAAAIFESAGFSSTIGTIAIAVVQVPMTLLGVLLMDRSGRRPLLMISAAGTCLGSFLIGLSFLMQDDQAWEEITPILAVVGAVLFRGMFALGMGGIPWVMMSEIFPINMKVLGGSLVTAVNWFFTWVISYTFTFLMEWSSDGTFFMFAIMGALTILFVAKLVPETKGRTLEEIQASMN